MDLLIRIEVADVAGALGITEEQARIVIEQEHDVLSESGYYAVLETAKHTETAKALGVNL